MQNLHKPVLIAELTAELPKFPGNYLDATLGSGGHSLAIVEHLLSGELVAGSMLQACDVDGNAWLLFKERLKIAEIDYKQKAGGVLIPDGLRVEFSQINFAKLGSNVDMAAREYTAITADLGLSQNQIAQVAGLSFRKNADLDMRYDSSLGVRASDLLKVLGQGQLAQLFKNYGDIEYAGRLARTIKMQTIETTWELNAAVLKIIAEIGVIDTDDYEFNRRLLSTTDQGPVKFSQWVAKEFARVYQALRIAVNLEYQNLEAFLNFAFAHVAPKGKILIITFHSGEQRLISQFCKRQENKSRFQYKVKQPSTAEVTKNSRSRSAQLNSITRIA